jgi:hypothetical protein
MTNLNFFRLTLSLVALSSSIATIPIAPSLAAIVGYDFSGTIDSGSLVGETYSGSLSFDNFSLTGFGFEELSVANVQFDFLGFTYTASEALAPPTVEFLDGSFLGLSFSVDSFDPSFSLTPGFFDVSEAFFAYSPTSGDAGFGDVQYTLVPESSFTLGLLTLSVLTMASSFKSKSKIKLDSVKD